MLGGWKLSVHKNANNETIGRKGSLTQCKPPSETRCSNPVLRAFSSKEANTRQQEIGNDVHRPPFESSNDIQSGPTLSIGPIELKEMKALLTWSLNSTWVESIKPNTSLALLSTPKEEKWINLVISEDFAQV